MQGRIQQGGGETSSTSRQKLEKIEENFGMGLIKAFGKWTFYLLSIRERRVAYHCCWHYILTVAFVLQNAFKKGPRYQQLRLARQRLPPDQRKSINTTGSRTRPRRRWSTAAAEEEEGLEGDGEDRGEMEGDGEQREEEEREGDDEEREVEEVKEDGEKPKKKKQAKQEQQEEADMLGMAGSSAGRVH
jgi:hypothetical protein